VLHTSKARGIDSEDLDEDSPYFEFFKRFGAVPGMPNGQGMRPEQPSRGLGSGFIVKPRRLHRHERARRGWRVGSHREADRSARVHGQGRGADKRTDIAVVKIDAKNLPALEFSTKPTVSVASG
jgi:serine protease Do